MRVAAARHLSSTVARSSSAGRSGHAGGDAVLHCFGSGAIRDTRPANFGEVGVWNELTSTLPSVLRKKLPLSSAGMFSPSVQRFVELYPATVTTISSTCVGV